MLDIFQKKRHPTARAAITEIDILKWAAGASVPMPYLPGFRDERVMLLLGVDENRLRLLLNHHRLTRRFLWRYQKEGGTWCSARLLHDLSAQCAFEERRLQSQVRLVVNTQRILGAEHPLVAIKGFSTYILTGNALAIRQSGDIDLFFPDLECLWSALTSQGLSGQRFFSDVGEMSEFLSENPGIEGTTQLAGHGGQHEYGVLEDGNLVVELHRNHPIIAYPDGLCRSDLRPKNHPNHWFQSFAPSRRTELDYVGIVEPGLHTSKIADVGLSVPTAPMAVLITCTHLFKHYATVPPTNGRPIIKLVELADICLLCDHPSFNPAQFDHLVQLHHAEDAVAFVCYLLDSYLIPAPSPIKAWKAPHVSFPRQLAWWKGVAAYLAPDDLLSLESVSDAALRLGVNDIVTTTSIEGRLWHTLFGEDKRNAIGRAIVHASCGTLPIALSVVWGEDALTFDFRFRAPLAANHVYHVEVRGDRYYDGSVACDIEFGLEVGSQSLTSWQDGKVSASVLTRGDQYHARLSLLWSALPSYLKRKSALPMILVIAVRDQTRSYQEADDPLMVVPVRIYSPHSQ